MPVLLKDYAPYPFCIDEVQLTIRLDPVATRVATRFTVRPNPEAPPGPFFLHGEGLRLLRAAIDGTPVIPDAVPGGIVCDVPEGPFIWEAEVEIDPASNTALEGLYISKGMFCTQCEAEGFRRISFYPDRPDVLARFHVRIESDLPVLLSNGNPVARGPGWAEWNDPWPKPAYLFALVAGDLVAVRDNFRTASGRSVSLAVWVRPGDEGKADYALDALKRSMAWDERAYGREYDLDVFSIVAVDDFNAGAMENKGLNIFNARYVLASPKTATDRDFESIEGIIAHEYFHNWTGNRITCRDWFQLSLKEGLTVFRDQEFSADMRSAAVKRIEDVRALRDRQFREDSGPLAHPVRPEKYFEIDNFYTATVYEKGAEVVSMLKHLVGDEAYRRALDLYFDRHDGQAVTIEDWLQVFEDTTSLDLSQFARWYSQAGTPRIKIRDEVAGNRYLLHVEQHSQPTPGQPTKLPQVIPIAVGLLDPDGHELLPTTVLTLSRDRQTFAFDRAADGWHPADTDTVPPEGSARRPIPSVLRGFSAPVLLDHASTLDERIFLLAHDTDPFNRWEAGRQIAKEMLIRLTLNGVGPEASWLDALERVLSDDVLEPSYRALSLSLPAEDDVARTIHENGRTPDPTAIHAARRRLKHLMAERLEDRLAILFERMAVPGPYSPDAESAGKRSLRLTALSLLSLLDGGARAADLFGQADNMTDELGALSTLLDIGAGTESLAEFYGRWSHERLVVDKWFALQIMHAPPGRVAEIVSDLTEHPDFDLRNPNRFRSVFGALAGNFAGFHWPSGRGYQLMIDWLLRLDPINPQTAARMATVFETMEHFDEGRQSLMREELRRLRDAPGISPNMGEIVSRLLST